MTKSVKYNITCLNNKNSYYYRIVYSNDGIHCKKYCYFYWRRNFNRKNIFI